MHHYSWGKVASSERSLHMKVKARNTAWGAGEQLTITANHHHEGAPLTVALMSGKRHFELLCFARYWQGCQINRKFSSIHRLNDTNYCYSTILIFIILKAITFYRPPRFVRHGFKTKYARNIRVL